MNKPTPIVIIQGGQYGSEAKGAIAAEICRRRDIRYAVRTGTINAGHTVYYGGKPYKMQTIPTGWVNPTTHLIIGPGAYIHPDVLRREIKMIQEAMPGNLFSRLHVDYRAGVHLDVHTDRATAADRHHLMGATGKGCSEAIISKIQNRGLDRPMLFREWMHEWPNLDDLQIVDTTDILHGAYDRGDAILLEGTQGSLLDLNLGPYPYTTHKPTQAAQWVVEAGLAPSMEYETILVCRTFPIRVAGNSGPMPDEIGWPELAREINRKILNWNRHRDSHLPSRVPIVAEWALGAFDQACQYQTIEMRLTEATDLDPHIMHVPERWRQDQREIYRWEASEFHARALASLSDEARRELANLFEYTTVTNKLRRIARWNWEAVNWSCQINRPTSIALTFMNYLRPELWGLTEGDFAYGEDVWSGFPQEVAERLQIPVQYLTFGPLGENVIGPATI